MERSGREERMEVLKGMYKRCGRCSVDLGTTSSLVGKNPPHSQAHPIMAPLRSPSLAKRFISSTLCFIVLQCAARWVHRTMKPGLLLAKERPSGVTVDLPLCRSAMPLNARMRVVADPMLRVTIPCLLKHKLANESLVELASCESVGGKA